MNERYPTITYVNGMPIDKWCESIESRLTALEQPKPKREWQEWPCDSNGVWVYIPDCGVNNIMACELRKGDLWMPCYDGDEPPAPPESDYQKGKTE